MVSGRAHDPLPYGLEGSTPSPAQSYLIGVHIRETYKRDGNPSPFTARFTSWP